MSDNRKISIALPTWERFQQTIDSFKQVLHDDRVAEVCITDDASMDGSFGSLEWYFKLEPKVLLFENENNLDCYFNKHQAMQNTNSTWCVLLDSDNAISKDYLDALYAIPEWDEKTIYQPSWSRPHFDFRKWSGLTLTKENVAEYANTDLMTALNAMNFFINRFEYLQVWDGSVNPISSDSIYFSYCWLNAGNKIYITPNLEYEHYISPHNNGHYQLNQHKTVEFHKELMNKIRAMK